MVIETHFRLSSGKLSLFINQQGSNHYEIALDSAGIIVLYRSGVLLGTANPAADDPNFWYELKVVTNAGEITVSIDGEEVISVIDPDPLTTGNILFRGGSTAIPDYWLDNFNLWTETIQSVSGLTGESQMNPAAPNQQGFAASASPSEGLILATQLQGRMFYLQTDGTLIHEWSAFGGFVDLSPDGQKIAFMWNGGILGNPTHIYVANADGSEITRLTDIHGYAPVWSPDSTRIVFASWKDQSQPSSYALYMVNGDGSGLRRISDYATSYMYGLSSWSPDGSKIAYTDSNGGSAQNFTEGTAIHLLTIAGCNPTGICPSTQLTQSTPINSFDDVPVWSSDSQTVYFRALRDGHSIYKADVGSGTETQLTFPSDTPDMIRGFNGISISPDDTMLAAIGSEFGGSIPHRTEVFLINPGNGAWNKITNYNHYWGGSAPRWSPDGIKLAWNKNDIIVVSNADGTGQSVIYSGALMADWGLPDLGLPTPTPTYTPTPDIVIQPTHIVSYPVCILEVNDETVNLRRSKAIIDPPDPNTNVADQASEGELLYADEYAVENGYAWWRVEKVDEPNQAEPILYVTEGDPNAVNYPLVEILPAAQEACDRIKNPVPTPTPTPTTVPTATPPVPITYFISCTATLPVTSNPDPDMMPIYQATSNGGYSYEPWYIRRGWLPSGDMVPLTFLEITDPADLAGLPQDYTWYKVEVPAGRVTNFNGTPVNPSAPLIGYIQASDNNTPRTEFLLPADRLDCGPLPTPDPPDPDGPVICAALQTELTALGVLPGGVTLQYYANYPVLNHADQFSTNFTYGGILTYSQGESLPTNLVKVTPCYYQMPSGNRVVRFGSNALILSLEDDFSGDPVAYQNFLQAAQYALILNYANYYATGPIDGPRDWCFQGDNLYQTAYARSELNYDYGTRYNLPVPWVNCTVRDPFYKSDGDGPCGTLPSAIYRAMGYFKIADFNGGGRNPYDLAQWYWNPAGFETMFETSGMYLVDSYGSLDVRFYIDGKEITFTRDGWHNLVFVDHNGNDEYDEGEEVIRNEAKWNSYDDVRTSLIWQSINPGDIVTIHTDEFRKNQQT